jgi:hypothetical protein
MRLNLCTQRFRDTVVLPVLALSVSVLPALVVALVGVEAIMHLFLVFCRDVEATTAIRPALG